MVEQLLSRDRPKPKADTLYRYLDREVQSHRIGNGDYRGRDVVGLYEKLQRKTETGQPIQLVVTAIAHKNPNTAVSGGRKNPDLAELDFLLHLRDIIEGITSFYAPGAMVTILTEGEFYRQNGNIFDVSEEEIASYEANVKHMAQVVLENRVRFVPLQEIAAKLDGFEESFATYYQRLRPEEYQRAISVMKHSMTDRQRESGITPEELARKYIALQKAKHRHNRFGKRIFNSYLEDYLVGQDYIYCSITGSERADVLNIDTSIKPTNFPQHGIGMLYGGSSVVKVIPFVELLEQIRATKTRAIYVDEIDPDIPFGFEKVGGRRQ